MNSVFYLLAAVVAGWLLQSFLTFRQSMAFNTQVRELRRSGTVSVGVGGRRYRGGRAFVGIAIGPSGVVTDALTLRGWTTFARSRPLPALIGTRVNRLCGENQIAGVRKAERAAAAQAAELYRRPRSSTVEATA